MTSITYYANGFNEQNSLCLVGLPCHRSGHDQSQSVNDAAERSTKQEGAEPRCPQPDRLERRRLSLEGLTRSISTVKISRGDLRS